jgi:hypothetical protein
VWHLHTSLHVAVSGPFQKLIDALVIWMDVMLDYLAQMATMMEPV